MRISEKEKIIVEKCSKFLLMVKKLKQA